MSHLSVPNSVFLEEVAELLKEGKSVVIRARGYSMSPFIRHEVDSVELVGASGVSVGDIALARVHSNQGVRYVMHRVIAKTEDGFTMMGDGNLSGTESVQDSDLLGIVRFIIRPDGSRVDVHSAGHLRRAHVWRMLLPVRRILLAVWRRVHK